MSHGHCLISAESHCQRTRCQKCGILKAALPQNYSEKKLQELRSAIAHGQAARNPTGKWIACRTCVGGQVAELECSHCNEWKGLKDFMKAQRRNPDRAVSLARASQLRG